ncbi:DNA polymerase kappa-like isoform X1 [Dermacentor andersoni]|uniref:DNA polymerase kappa-like isoform X1 n=2 Tax=Dermacentor andersoni TaxID=34620 RepID=UPI0021550016|nr:DNA polymerase kappa-like isoform X1 [Dermacentor andersoni]
MEARADVKILELNASKAGLQGVDKDHVNRIIQEASKGTPYYEHQRKRQRRINVKIEAMLAELKTLSPAQLQASQCQMDAIAERMEYTRDLNRVIVHVDMDAFYAAVEMLENPSLRDKPMAVGSMGMLSTSNYEARKFGVRAAMPGFIGKKLCPSLIIVRPNFDKYTAFSRKVRQVLVQYDEDFTQVGLDEAYLDITEYMVNHNVEAEDVVQEMRQKIFDATQLTASAGIAANMFLAKVCSDIRKPNNQFRLPNDVDSIRKFVSSLPIRKVPGIGGVQEQLLMALGVHTCHDIWIRRAEIGHLFGEVTARFYLRAALGLGCTEVKCDSNRKSKSVEETFAEISNPQNLISKCEELCEELHQQIQEEGISGRVVTVKMKTVMFDVMTRSITLENATCKLETIKQAALRLLQQEIAAAKPGQPLRLRLMGVRLSGLDDGGPLSSSQPTLSAFLSARRTAQCPICQKTLESSSPEFVNAHVDTCLGEQEPGEVQQSASDGTDLHKSNYNKNRKTSGTPDVLQLGSTPETPCVNLVDKDLKCNMIRTSDGAKSMSFKEQASEPEEDPASMECPVCGQVIWETNWSKVNEHIDTCLNKPMIREMLSSQDFTSSPMPEKRKIETPKSQRSQKRPKFSQPRQRNSITNYLSPSCSKS